MMSTYFLGVDTGATKTHALIANSEGQVVGYGKAGPGNHEIVEYKGVITALNESVSQALHMANLTIQQISGAGFGIAGYDWPSERKPTLDAIASLGLTAPLEAVNDMVVGLIAGASQGWGIVIDAGTGTNCRGWSLDGREGMITGLGRFGEHGGAGDLVEAAVVAAAHEWSLRGPTTQLSRELLRITGASDLTDLLEGLTMEKYQVDSSFAPVVFQVARQGDAVARDIINWLGTELGESVVAVIRQLKFQETEFEVVMIGSLFKGGPLLVEPMIQRVHREAPGAAFKPLLAPPVAGGVLLGMQAAGFNFSPIQETLNTQAKIFIESVEPRVEEQV